MTPLGPRFFWAPAYSRPYFDTSSGRLKTSLLASQARNAPSGGVGSVLNCVPKIVLLDWKWT